MAPINITGIPQFYGASLSELSKISFGVYYETIKPLIFFIIGITIYALFVFKFYRFLSKRDVLELKLNKYSKGFSGFLEKIVKSFFYVVENLLLIPLFIFFWFVVMVAILLILSKSTAPNQLLVIAMSLVAAIRVTSYYSENLSQDLAKMIPFALLGVYLVDSTFFSFQNSLEVAKQLSSLWQIGIYYLLFVIGMEFTLRIIFFISKLFGFKTKEKT